MKKSFLIIILSLITIQIFAQQHFSISGSVHASGEAISNASVQLLPATTIALTNDNGYFRFSRLAPGNYIIRIAGNGYPEHQDTVTISDKNISLVINLTANTKN